MINIILVEDDLDDVYFFKAACKQLKQDINVTRLENGKQLLAYVELNDCSDSIILLDLNMPVMSGMESLEKLNEMGQINSLVIVTYTTSDSESDIKRAYDFGVKSFVTKPDTIEKVSKFLSTLTEYWFTHNSPPGQKK